MPTALVNTVKIYYEVTGTGFPLVWCHEFGQSLKGWDYQVKFFSQWYKVITYNARGYPPSDVPTELSAYSEGISVEDLYQLLLHLGIHQAYVGGLSMGANITLNFGISHPDFAKGLIVAGRGASIRDSGSFKSMMAETARQLEADGISAMAESYFKEPTRIQLLRKNPKRWRWLCDEFASHSALGSLLTIKGAIQNRPTIYELEPKLRQLTVPTLIMVGDEDAPRIEPALLMKQMIPRSGLAIIPQTGHTINLEEPELFNQMVLRFLTLVEAGTWA